MIKIKFSGIARVDESAYSDAWNADNDPSWDELSTEEKVSFIKEIESLNEFLNESDPSEMTIDSIEL